jgi:hypothetical protein
MAGLVLVLSHYTFSCYSAVTISEAWTSVVI